MCMPAYVSVRLSVCLSLRLSVCLFLYLSVSPPIPICLSVRLSNCLFISLSICLAVRLPTNSVHLSVSLSACLLVRLSVCLSACLPACLCVCKSKRSNGNRQSSDWLPQLIVVTGTRLAIGNRELIKFCLNQSVIDSEYSAIAGSIILSMYAYKCA
jgi:hypothetical protein